jgi:hypothetical protein
MVTAAAPGLYTRLQLCLRAGEGDVDGSVQELDGRVGATAENILAKPADYSL